MNNRSKSIILCGLFAALTAIGAFIRIPIPNVNFTLQLVFVALAGALLGPKLGLLSQLIYIALGLSGLQIFSQGGGISYVLKPSFGYLIGFALTASVIGLIIKNFKELSYFKILAACLVGLFVSYLVGVPYMYLILKYNLRSEITILKALWIGCGVFMIPDLIKMTLVSFITLKVLPITGNLDKNSNL